MMKVMENEQVFGGSQILDVEHNNNMYCFTESNNIGFTTGTSIEGLDGICQDEVSLPGRHFMYNI
jgi:hypothetical protein